MIQEIINGISIAINNAFGDDYDIYTESIEQGFKEPCFFINMITSQNVKFLGTKYLKENLFCIQYFPKNDDTNEECMSVLEKMYSCLELITIDSDLSRGTEMRGEIIDGVLNFFVNYDMFVYKTRTVDEMEILDLTSNVER